MKISDQAVSMLSIPDNEIIVAQALKRSQYWIRDLVRANKPNGPLTTYKALLAIQKISNLKIEEILIDEEIVAQTK